MTAIEIKDLPALLDEAGIPAGIRAKLDQNPYMVQRVLDSLGEIDFDSIETNRAYAFLLIADRSSSIRRFRDSLVNCYRGAVEKLKNVKTVGMLFAGCIAITSEVEGGEVILPIQPIGSAKIDDDFEFEPSGTTPLYDTMVVALVALRILVVLFKRNRIQLTAMAYLLSDGDDVGSVLFNATDTAEMVALMTTGRRKHRMSAVAVGTRLKTMFQEMGITPDAIRDGVDDLETLFDEMSQSVTATSQGGDTGGF
jgi:hypothetical protein